MKRGAVVGGAMVWATPVVQTVMARPAFAGTPDPNGLLSFAAVTYLRPNGDGDDDRCQVKVEADSDACGRTPFQIFEGSDGVEVGRLSLGDCDDLMGPWSQPPDDGKLKTSLEEPVTLNNCTNLCMRFTLPQDAFDVWVVAYGGGECHEDGLGSDTPFDVCNTTPGG
jgi:hypothetical protein